MRDPLALCLQVCRGVLRGRYWTGGSCADCCLAEPEPGSVAVPSRNEPAQERWDVPGDLWRCECAREVYRVGRVGRSEDRACRGGRVDVVGFLSPGYTLEHATLRGTPRSTSESVERLRLRG